MERISASVTLSAGWKRFVIAIVAGALAALMLAPFSILLVGFISFPILIWLIDGATGNPDRGVLLRLWPAFFIGWSFGFGYFVASLWWIANSMLVEADQFAWAVPLASLGLPAFLAIYYGLATAVSRLFWTDGLMRLFVLAAAFGLAEWLRGVAFTGFPWNAVGQGLTPFPLMMQSLSLVGGHTMNVLAVFIFAAPALLVTGRGGRPAMALAALLVAGHLGFGYYQLNIAPQPKIDGPVFRLVQPSISQVDKLDDKERANVFEAHLALSVAPAKDGAKRPDYIVWPETSIPFILTRSPDALRRIADVLGDGQILIAGAVRVEGDGGSGDSRYYNSAYVIDSQGQIIVAADKVHLVPFGEYLPFEAFFKKLDMQAVAAMPGGFSAAPTRTLLTMPSGLKLLPLICYEIIFPDEVEPDPKIYPDAILNITNDEWFGDSPGPRQHLLQARLRAAETGLPVIRDANSGVSAIIDGRGRVIAGLDFGTKGFADATLPSRADTLVPKKYRDLSFWLLLSSIFLVALTTRMSFIFKRN
jgi:apolipoprotein N-acyltransferase